MKIKRKIQIHRAGIAVNLKMPALMALFVFLILILFLGTAAAKPHTSKNITADFTAATDNSPVVQFNDASTGNINSWLWDFGDGTSSTAQNPSHTYTAAGTYQVTLTVAQNKWWFDTTTKDVSVSDPPTATASKPLANFAANPSSGQAPLQVQFDDTSTGSPSSWSWSFGDGATSRAENPSYTYKGAGTYGVTLIASNSAGSSSKTASITVAPVPPVANFSASTSSGTAPLAVQFTDSSTGTITSWSWDFGDGGHSTAQNPSYIYNNAGTFTPTLTVSNESGSDTKAGSAITVVGAPTSTQPPPPAPTSGVVYYVDSVGGNDSNPGTIDQPWKSIGKVNSFPVPAGASVLFKRGDVWNETLQPQNAGSSGTPITFGAYGTGAAPLIDGQSSRVPIIISKSFITLQDFEVRNSNGDGIYVTSSSGNVTGVLIQGVTSYNSAQEGISFNGNTKYTLNNCTLTNSTSHDNGYAGIKGYGRIDHITVSYNKVYHNGLHPVSQWGWHGISFYGPDTTNRASYIIIEHNEVYDQLEGTNSSSKEGTGIHCDDNCDHMTVRYNYCHDNQGPGICLNANTYDDVYYNVCAYNGTGTSPYTAGIYLTNSKYVNIYNNVLCGDKNYGIYVLNMSVNGTNFNIKNNIFINNGSYELRVYASSGSVANFVCDYNCYYNPSKTNLIQYLDYGAGGLSWWQGRGFDLNGMDQDPSFISLAKRDFHLQSSSPCIDAGVDVGLNQDFDGTSVPQNQIPDMGAFEYHQ